MEKTENEERGHRTQVEVTKWKRRKKRNKKNIKKYLRQKNETKSSNFEQKKKEIQSFFL